MQRRIDPRQRLVTIDFFLCPTGKDERQLVSLGLAHGFSREFSVIVQICWNGARLLVFARSTHDWAGTMRFAGRDGAKVPSWRTSTAMSPVALRSEEHTSELQSLMRSSYAVFCV